MSEGAGERESGRAKEWESGGAGEREIKKNVSIFSHSTALSLSRSPTLPLPDNDFSFSNRTYKSDLFTLSVNRDEMQV
jgi:hypothetical protein